jgi:hypothetical protein
MNYTLMRINDSYIQCFWMHLEEILRASSRLRAFVVPFFEPQRLEDSKMHEGSAEWNFFRGPDILSGSTINEISHHTSCPPVTANFSPQISFITSSRSVKTLLQSPKNEEPCIVARVFGFRAANSSSIFLVL